MLDYSIKVPFFDGSAQYLADKVAIDKALQNVLAIGSYINGAEVDMFANNLASYLSVNHVITCANGTDALCLALMALNLKPGDEVIVPTFNFIAAAEAVSLLGLMPVFADVSQDDFNISAANIANKLTAKTKAIIVVHLFGAAADMDPIMNLANQHQLFVIEDVAQALGSEYKGQKVGTVGDIGCTSFFPTKNLACFGDGGAVFTNNPSLATKVKMLANHGQQQKYKHKYIGLNSRLDTIQAVVLSLQLAKLDEQIEKRRFLASNYIKTLNHLPIRLPNEKSAIKHSYNQFCICLKTKSQRDEIKHYLKEHDIATMIYYEEPNHLQEAFSSFQHDDVNFPVAQQHCDTVLALPISPNITEEQQKYIVYHINSFLANG